MLKGLKTLERDRLKSVLPVSFTYYINLKKYKILPIVNKKLRTEHTRRLPHFHRVGATFFITTNLYGAIPKETLKQLQIKRDELIGRIKQENQVDKEREIYMIRRAYFYELDTYLDACQNSPKHLTIPEVAAIVEKEIRKHDGKYYNLVAFTLMPNHMHIVLDFSIQLSFINPFDLDLYTNVSEVMGKIKGSSSFYANKILGNSGKSFWGVSYYDRYIRDYNHFFGAVNYTINNVVKAKIATHWMNHPYTWLISDYQKLNLIFPNNR